jgi:hypothetical protein
LPDFYTPGASAKSEKALTNSGSELRLLAGDIAYMSRHPIFEQLPALKEDIKIPMDLIESTPGDKLEMFVTEFLSQTVSTSYYIVYFICTGLQLHGDLQAAVCLRISTRPRPFLLFF